MADTTSIASRMEKLAQLKRMKQGLASSPAPAKTVESEAVEPEIDVNDLPRPSLAAEIEAMTVADSASESTETAGFGDMVHDDPAHDHEITEFESADPIAMEDDSVSVEEEDDQDETIQSDADFREETNTNFVMSDADDEDDEDLDTELPADLMEADDDDDTGEEFVPVAASVEPEENAETVAVEEVAEDDTDGVLSAADLGIDDETIDGLGGLGGTMAGLDEVAEEAPLPDFTTKEIDPELLEREFESEAQQDDIPTTTQIDDGRVSVAFDESRSTLLNHVSRQMNCSVEDVVVTALDWYLDALFGEDGEAKTG